MKRKVGCDCKVDLADLQCFSVFDWLLTKEEKAESAEICERMYAESVYIVAPVDNPARAHALLDGPAAKKTKASLKTTTMVAVDNVANLFI